MVKARLYSQLNRWFVDFKSLDPEPGDLPEARKTLVRSLRYFFHSITFVKKKFELKRQFVHGTTLLNHEFIFTEFNRTGILPTSFSYTHGADQGSYVGSGLLYFAIPYMLKAKTCVCIGSGGGFVPRFMYQAQVEARVEGARTVLVDADRGGLGRPDYLGPNSFLRAHFPAIEIVNCDSANFAAEAQLKGLKIDYLHIDGDHTYGGALSDFEKYLPLMSDKGLISFHDTDGTLPCAEALAEIKAVGHNVIDLSFIGSGIAIIQISR
jgi:hypothetical protein